MKKAKFMLSLLVVILSACVPSSEEMILQTAEVETTTAVTSTPSPEPIVTKVTTSGTILEDETWSGEIHLTGSIFLANGATLTIKPGTIIYIASNSDDQQMGIGFDDEYTRSHNDPVRLKEWSKNAILIDGRGGIMHAIGTPEEPITFRPEGDSTSSAQWDGIYIERGTIKYAIILYGGRTAIQALGNVGEEMEIAYNEVPYSHWAGIASHTNNVWIHHNIVEGGGHQAISVQGNTIAENNIVLNAQTGFGVENSNGAVVRNNIAIDCVRAVELRGGNNFIVENNTFARVSGPPDGWYYQEELIYPAFNPGGGIELYVPTVARITNNIVYGPFNSGIGLHQIPQDGSIVAYNLIWGTKDMLAGAGRSSNMVWTNIEDDPLFINPQNLDFHLLSNSSAIDSGDPEIIDADGSISDIGAYGGEFGTNW